MNSCRMITRLSIFVVVMFGIQITSQAQQCFDGGTSPYYYVQLLRTNGNNIYTLAGTYTEGPNRNNWFSTTTMSEFKNGFVFRNRENIMVSGAADAFFSFNDVLSQSDVGPGTYSFSSSHRATCGSNVRTGTGSGSLVVNRPTIADPGVAGVWWLGSFGAHDAFNGYYPSAGFNASKNCNPGDTCTEAGNWTIASTDGGGLSADTYTGTSIIVTANAPNRIAGGMILQFDLNGFASEPRTFTVNTPYRLMLNASIDAAYDNDDNEVGVGWETITNYSIIDRFGNVLAPIAYNEACEE